MPHQLNVASISMLSKNLIIRKVKFQMDVKFDYIYKFDNIYKSNRKLCIIYYIPAIFSDNVYFTDFKICLLRT